MTNKALTLSKKVLDYFSNNETHSIGGVSWALIYDNQSIEEVSKYQGQPCFAGLASRKQGAKYFIFWCFSRRVFSDDNKKKKLEDHEIDYIKYIVKDSIFAPCFQTKNVNKIFNRGVIMKTDKPAQFVYSAATCIRYVSEYPDLVKMWSIFREHIGDDAALILAHLFLPKHPDMYISQACWSSQHKWMVGPAYFGVDQFKRFLERDLTGMNGFPSFSENTDYSRVVKIWNCSAICKIPENKRLQWTNGFEKIESNWSKISYREYNYKNLKEDLKAMMEINRA